MHVEYSLLAPSDSYINTPNRPKLRQNSVEHSKINQTLLHHGLLRRVLGR